MKEFLILATLVVVAAGEAQAQNGHGLVVRSEDRCSPYSRKDYSYSQSVERRIVDAQGGLFSPYSLKCFRHTRESDIEHIVAVSEAHDSGLCEASIEVRKQFARDLDNLTLAAPRLNRYTKSDKDMADWVPQFNRCWYVNRVVSVKRKYGLSVDPQESEAINQVLDQCGGAYSMVRPISCTGRKSIPNSCGAVDRGKCGPYRNCTELRRDYPSGVRRGHCAYQSRMDRDKDGWACE